MCGRLGPELEYRRKTNTNQNVLPKFHSPSSSENTFLIIFTTVGFFLRFDSVTATARTKQRMIAKDIFIFERLNSLLQQLCRSEEYAW
ncbi:hypothetical protein IscW_ISCW003123 [Ixodes scapularis]|uniref:Uncharacterized protein n=1 Tax=Ixodes scapularis TaxID=6945 RepID=B7PBF2_IXOSC|nr:hypothetical protein IscW_ISCW003123 [Ixodes scapularis]|eukprot:XP_002408005.1 hypothetical protein IscW_ISCW003123 [Ixodes scapularis]